MSRCVRSCDACGGVYYDGEPCRGCELHWPEFRETEEKP